MIAIRPALAAASAALILASHPLRAAQASKERITLEAVFAEKATVPTPSSFAWSPDGTKLAFLQAEAAGGADLLRVRRLSDRSVIGLTRTAEGPPKVPVSSFVWSPKGDALAALSEGDLILFTLPVRGGEPPAPRRLTRTEAAEKDPKFSPDGKWIGFARDGDLFAVEVVTGSERRLTSDGSDDVLNGTIDWVYEEEFGISSGWWWSPDSARMAYLQLDQREVPRYPLVDWLPVHPVVTWQRYPKAGDRNPAPRLGVVEIGADAPSTRWMDLGAETDIYVPRVAWVGDGSRLAAQRLDRGQQRLDLMICDPVSGRCDRALTEIDPHWINIGDDWRFLTKGAGGGPGFVWGSERDGFRHLYIHALDGREVRRLTSGRWIVTDLASVDEASGWVHFVATEKDPLERHVYRVRLDGTGMTRLSQEQGWHGADVAPAGGAWLDTFSTQTSPPTVTLRSADGGELAVLDDGEARRVAGLRLADIEYHQVKAADGAILPAVMMKPADFDPRRKYPVLIYVYGGPHAQIVTRGWPGWRALWHHKMADSGVLVWSLDNRGAAGRGHAWETPIHRTMGRGELADQIEGAAYLRKLPYVDAGRIGIWGWSYGGYMTLYALTNAPGTFRMGVSVAPVTHWKDYDTIYTERYMERPADNADGYRDSAPLSKAAELRDPLLLVHGTADDNVHMQNSVQMIDALVAAGRPVEVALYPGKGHGISGQEARLHLFARITRFIEENLLK